MLYLFKVSIGLPGARLFEFLINESKKMYKMIINKTSVIYIANHLYQLSKALMIRAYVFRF